MTDTREQAERELSVLADAQRRLRGYRESGRQPDVERYADVVAALAAAEQERDEHANLVAFWRGRADAAEARAAEAEREALSVHMDRGNAIGALAAAEARVQQLEQALAEIAHHSYDVMRSAEAELRSVKEIARAVLAAAGDEGAAKEPGDE